MPMSKLKRTPKQASYIHTTDSMILSADSLSVSEDAIFWGAKTTSAERIAPKASRIKQSASSL